MPLKALHRATWTDALAMAGLSLLCALSIALAVVLLPQLGTPADAAPASAEASAVLEATALARDGQPGAAASLLARHLLNSPEDAAALALLNQLPPEDPMVAPVLRQLQARGFAVTGPR